MTQRRLQRESTALRLLQVAMALFAERGIASVRTLDVAKAAGASHGSVFAHFPTREALVCSAIEEFGRVATARLHTLAAEGSGVREVLAAHLQGIAENEGFYSHLVEEASSLPKGARETLVMVQSALSHHLSQALEREEAAGSIRPVPHPFVFNLWVGLVHYHLVNRDYFAPGGSVVHKLGPGMLDGFCALLSS